MAAFGVRNFSDPLKGLSEMRRVIRKEGMIIILEFSKPDGFPFRHVYNFYFRHLLPFIGSAFSGNSRAYRYLHESVMDFAENKMFMRIMENAGFSEVKQERLTRGIASVYTGVKK
jgi:demethylmenaquinone methyltransferase/2-methoxy-6-polyprenyl-1,4-benzoquinol methylase